MTRPFIKHLASFCSAALIGLPFALFANQYNLPPSGNTVIGDITYTSAANGETLVNIGQRYNVGVNAMLSANPGITPEARLPGGTFVTVPSEFILPPLPRRGIVINLAEMRMYYYPPGTDAVMTYPIGIGKIGKTIRVGPTSIVRKATNPTWTPPPSIREFNREQGIELPTSMPAGPDNPLGPYAIYLGVPTYLMHSTIFPESIGRRASFGCFRMNETDIKEFFPLVTPGTPVDIVYMPSKVGWSGNRLYFEAHDNLVEHGDAGGLNSMIDSVEKNISHSGVTMVNWQLVSYLADQRDGVPHEIGFRIR